MVITRIYKIYMAGMVPLTIYSSEAIDASVPTAYFDFEFADNVRQSYELSLTVGTLETVEPRFNRRSHSLTLASRIVKSAECCNVIESILKLRSYFVSFCTYVEVSARLVLTRLTPCWIIHH